MSLSALETEAEGPITSWLRGLWEYYQGYTHTAVHTASAAALTAFGLLIFVNRLFAVVAIITYICPPIILYSLNSDLGRPSPSSTAPTEQGDSETSAPMVPENDVNAHDGDTDSDNDDGDTDSDGIDSDTDG